MSIVIDITSMIDTRFPEDFYPPVNWAPYLEQVNQGYSILQSSKICFCGITRGTPRQLERNLRRLEYLAQLCDLSWVIYTNDDIESLSILKRFEKSNLILHEELNKKQHESVECLSRYRDMAYYRNQYLENLPECDFVAVMDFDIHHR